MESLLVEKEDRLCTRRYHRKLFPSQSKDGLRRFVYDNDAEEIKAHKWFKDIDWDTLHLQVPPFIPELDSAGDSRYFEEEEPISDFSESLEDDGTPYRMNTPTPKELEEGMHHDSEWIY